MKKEHRPLRFAECGVFVLCSIIDATVGRPLAAAVCELISAVDLVRSGGGKRPPYGAE